MGAPWVVAGAEPDGAVDALIGRCGGDFSLWRLFFGLRFRLVVGHRWLGFFLVAFDLVLDGPRWVDGIFLIAFERVLDGSRWVDGVLDQHLVRLLNCALSDTLEHEVEGDDLGKSTRNFVVSGLVGISSCLQFGLVRKQD